jgi:predicted enzyme related to lactoylglutathione lyase
MADNFFWYDVMTSDVEAAKKFYADVVGWEMQESATPGYTLLAVDGKGVAGLMAIPPDAAAMGVPPCWMGYIKVADVDDTVARIVAEGGKLHKGPIDIPDIIRFAVVADPQGAGFMIATPMPQGEPPRPAPGTPGTFGWHELYAGDGASAFAFYEKLFGWTKDQAMDMGPIGTYQLFATGGAAVGAIMTKPPAVPMPAWGYYINTDAIDAAAARVTAGGGKVVHGPMEVPGGQWIVQCLDPQGAFFCLLANRR